MPQKTNNDFILDTEVSLCCVTDLNFYLATFPKAQDYTYLPHVHSLSFLHQGEKHTPSLQTVCVCMHVTEGACVCWCASMYVHVGTRGQP